MDDDVEGILYGDDGRGEDALGARPAEERPQDDEDSASASGSDDFEIVLGGAEAQGAQPVGKTPAPAQAQAGASAAARPGVDLSAVGQIGGVSLFDVDLDDPAAASAGGFADRPWRAPGADITDYFNYGFTEATWKQYCAKQRALRDEYGGRAAQAGARGERERERSRERSRDRRRDRSGRREPDTRRDESRRDADRRDDARRDDARRDDRPSRPGRPSGRSASRPRSRR